MATYYNDVDEVIPVSAARRLRRKISTPRAGTNYFYPSRYSYPSGTSVSLRQLSRAQDALAKIAAQDEQFNQIANPTGTGYGYAGGGAAARIRQQFPQGIDIIAQPGVAPNVGSAVGYYDRKGGYLGPLYDPSGNKLPMPKGATGIHGTAGFDNPVLAQYPADKSRLNAARATGFGVLPSGTPTTNYEKSYAAGYGPPAIQQPETPLLYDVGKAIPGVASSAASTAFHIPNRVSTFIANFVNDRLRNAGDFAVKSLQVPQSPNNPPFTPFSGGASSVGRSNYISPPMGIVRVANEVNSPSVPNAEFATNNVMYPTPIVSPPAPTPNQTQIAAQPNLYNPRRLGMEYTTDFY